MELDRPIANAQVAIFNLRFQRPISEGPAQRLIDEAIAHFQAGILTLEVLQNAPEKTGKDS